MGTENDYFDELKDRSLGVYQRVSPDEPGEEKEGLLPESDKKQGICTVLWIVLLFEAIIIGSGIITLPYTAVQTGLWWWLLIVAVVVLLVVFTLNRLNESVLYALHVSESPEQTRDPFPLLGELVAGKWGRRLITLTFIITSISLSISLLLLLAETMTSMISIKNWNHSSQVRIWCPIACAVILPVLMLGYVKDNIGVAVMGFLGSFTTLLVVLISSFMMHFEFKTKEFQSEINKPFAPTSFSSVITAIGTVLMVFVQPIILLPNVSVEFHDSRKINAAVVISFVAGIILYIISIFSSYTLLKGAIQPSILSALAVLAKDISSIRILLTFGSVLFMIHLLMSMVLILNPTSQQIEKMTGVPFDFTWKRVVSRSLIIAVVCCVAVAVPNFTPVLSLVGGFMMTLVFIAFPLCAYLKLFKPSRYIDWPIKLLILGVIAFAITSLVVESISIVNIEET